MERPETNANNAIFVRIEDLLFDPANPRLPTTKKNSDDEEVLKYMIIKGMVTDLMLSIGEQGYFSAEALLVVPSEQHSGKFEVVEGNRRLAALKLLSNPYLAPIKKAAIKEIADNAKMKVELVPVIVYKDRNDFLQYLGYRHITGVQQWDSLAKARYLYQLKTELESTETDYKKLLYRLSKIIGSNVAYVKKLLLGYELFLKIESDDFYEIPNLSEEHFDFSLITTATSYKKIGDFVGVDYDNLFSSQIDINENHLEELVNWIYAKNKENKSRVGDSRNLKSLASIVSSPTALQVFRNGKSIEEAIIYTEEPTLAFSKFVTDALSKVKDALNSIHLVKKPTSSTISEVDEIIQISKNIQLLLRSKSNETES